MLVSPSARAWVHAFFTERRPSEDRDLAKDTPVRKINSLGADRGGHHGVGMSRVLARRHSDEVLNVSDARHGQAMERLPVLLHDPSSIAVADPKTRLNKRLTRLKPLTTYADLAGWIGSGSGIERWRPAEVSLKPDTHCKPGAMPAKQ